MDTRKPAQEKIRYAKNALHLALTGAMRRVLPEVAGMLAEREPAFTTEAALADIGGHLADLVEVPERPGRMRRAGDRVRAMVGHLHFLRRDRVDPERENGGTHSGNQAASQR